VAFCLAGTTILAACSSAPQQSRPTVSQPTAASQAKPAMPGKPSPYSCTYSSPARAGGNFYKDDGPLDLPDDIDQILEPLPRNEPLSRWSNNPYTVLGQNFVPMKKVGDYTGRGIGSWYGRKFHGKKTSSGEVYDMFQMTAAHPTLPIPSYAKVTNLKNGRSVTVRINDRGPFLKGREIDLSFLAACRLGYASMGSANVEVVSLLPGQYQDEPAVIPAAEPAALPEPAITQPVANLPPANGQDFYLQFGAFGSRSNAESFQAHIARELDDQQIARLGIQQAGNLFRVRLGPFADRATALAEAEKLTGQKNLSAVISK